MEVNKVLDPDPITGAYISNPPVSAALHHILFWFACFCAAKSVWPVISSVVVAIRGHRTQPSDIQRRRM
jgi:hypothetical protein